MRTVDTTTRYLNRTVDRRMVVVIESNFDNENVILDLGCGSGLYGEALKRRCRKLFGFDHDSTLCRRAEARGVYDHVYCDDIGNIAKYIDRVDAIFCSEFLEHMRKEAIGGILRGIEGICNNKLIITVPNPLSPHFKQDPTHMLKYNIYSLLRILNTSAAFQYKLCALGFSEYNLRNPVYATLNPIAKRVPILSPTVLYVGERRTGQ